MFFAFLLLQLCGNGFAASPEDFKHWTPDPQKGLTICEGLIGSSGVYGTACGGASIKKMLQLQSSLRIDTQMGYSFNLLNIPWISREAYTTQRDFYQVCKPYLIRLYDGLHRNYNAMRCVTGFPNPVGLDPACNDTSNLILRKGSGYCMSQPICGAEYPVTFYQPPGLGSYALWGSGIISFIQTKNITMPLDTPKCYAYGATAQSAASMDNLMNNI